jgi:hypothetical protein
VKYEWNDKKAKSNKVKHGVAFDEATSIFDDPFHLSVFDKRYDDYEERWITIGLTSKDRVIVVAHVYFFDEDGNELMRIISARKSTKKEREQYEKI